MASKRLSVPFKEIQLKVVGPSQAFLASRVQRLEINTNLPSTDIDELGNNLHAGVVTDTPEVTVTFQAMDVSPTIYAALTGSFPFPAAGVSINNLKDIDVVGQVKDDSVADFVKTMHGRKMRITGFNFSYSVDGESTEEWTAIGSEKRWFKNDVIVEKSTTPGSSITLANTPTTLKNGNKLLSLIVDGVYFDEVASSPSTNEFSVSGGTVTLGTAIVTQAVAVYYISPGAAGNNWSYIADSSIPAAVRGKDIPVTIGVNSIKRVQSVSIRGEFPNQAIKEMGNTSIVGYTSQVPRVTGNISVLDTDLDLIGLFATGNLGQSFADTEYGVSEFTASGLSLKVEIKNRAGTILKTVYVPSITITSEGHSTSVGGNSAQTFDWKSTTGELVIYSGAKS